MGKKYFFAGLEQETTTKKKKKTIVNHYNTHPVKKMYQHYLNIFLLTCSTSINPLRWSLSMTGVVLANCPSNKDTSLILLQQQTIRNSGIRFTLLTLSASFINSLFTSESMAESSDKPGPTVK